MIHRTAAYKNKYADRHSLHFYNTPIYTTALQRITMTALKGTNHS